MKANKEIESLKNDIKISTHRLEVFERGDSYGLNEKKWNEKRESLVDALNESIERFDDFTFKIMVNNKCLKVQKRINKHRKSIGLPPYTITAIM